MSIVQGLTCGVIGQLKAKLAKLKRELLTPSGGGGGGGGTFPDCSMALRTRLT
jgi:ribosome-interacting GTPase 1